MTMDRIIERLQPLSEFLRKIQDVLDFDGWELHTQFATRYGLGRVALIGSLLGIVWGVHAILLIFIGLEMLGFFSVGLLEGSRLQMAWQWCFYILSMCSFHLLEFFTTAVYNPTVASSESYLVNHSKAYTAAFLIALSEFWLRFCFFPHASVVAYFIGLILVLVAQTIRSWAMGTCGESFNHMIQTSKKDNHVLITRGIYKYFRHPSYVGFYYWSLGTQLVLNNWLSLFIFSAASLMFFRRRIPYEEESLLELFPDEYEEYAKRTWIGIPFIPNRVPRAQEDKKED